MTLDQLIEKASALRNDRPDLGALPVVMEQEEWYLPVEAEDIVAATLDRGPIRGEVVLVRTKKE